VSPEDIASLSTMGPLLAGIAATTSGNSKRPASLADLLEYVPQDDASGDMLACARSIAMSLKRIADVLCPRVTGPENGSVFVGELSDVLSDRFHDLAHMVRP
jgi:hypothetical protein